MWIQQSFSEPPFNFVKVILEHKVLKPNKSCPSFFSTSIDQKYQENHSCMECNVSKEGLNCMKCEQHKS